MARWMPFLLVTVLAAILIVLLMVWNEIAEFRSSYRLYSCGDRGTPCRVIVQPYER